MTIVILAPDTVVRHGCPRQGEGHVHVTAGTPLSGAVLGTLSGDWGATHPNISPALHNLAAALPCTPALHACPLATPA